MDSSPLKVKIGVEKGSKVIFKELELSSFDPRSLPEGSELSVFGVVCPCREAEVVNKDDLETSETAAVS